MSAEQRCCIPSCVHGGAAPPTAGAATDDADERPTFFGVPEARLGDDLNSDSVLRRALWLRRIKKYAAHADPETALVCNRHFTQGFPAGMEETSAVDWLPNIELATPEELSEEVEEMDFEEDDDEEEDLDEEFITYNKRQREKVERLKRENTALKRKISELSQTSIIQGMRKKMLKSMKVKEEPEDDDKEERPPDDDQERIKFEHVEVKSEIPDAADDNKPKLQINSLKMKLSNILSTIK